MIHKHACHLTSFARDKIELSQIDMRVKLQRQSRSFKRTQDNSKYMTIVIIIATIKHTSNVLNILCWLRKKLNAWLIQSRLRIWCASKKFRSVNWQTCVRPTSKIEVKVIDTERSLSYQFAAYHSVMRLKMLTFKTHCITSFIRRASVFVLLLLLPLLLRMLLQRDVPRAISFRDLGYFSGLFQYLEWPRIVSSTSACACVTIFDIMMWVTARTLIFTRVWFTSLIFINSHFSS